MSSSPPTAPRATSHCLVDTHERYGVRILEAARDVHRMVRLLPGVPMGTRTRPAHRQEQLDHIPFWLDKPRTRMVRALGSPRSGRSLQGR